MQLHSNVIITSPRLIAEKPEAVRACLKAFAKGAKEGAIASMKAKDSPVNAPREVKRLKLPLETASDSEDARKKGFGQLAPRRLQLMAEQVAKAYATQRPTPVQAV